MLRLLAQMQISNCKLMGDITFCGENTGFGFVELTIVNRAKPKPVSIRFRKSIMHALAKFAG